MALSKKDLPSLVEFQETLDDFSSQFFDLASPLGYERILPELYSLKNKIKDTIRALDTFWTFEGDGGLCDIECDTKEDAIDWAEDSFIGYILTDGFPKDGSHFKKDINLLRFEHDEDGERVEVERIPFTIEYTHEQSDRAEHFRQSDYI